jgi:hypothetical protein
MFVKKITKTINWWILVNMRSTPAKCSSLLTHAYPLLPLLPSPTNTY